MSKLLVSFSGGETSGYMAQMPELTAAYDQIMYVFANTGQENEETLNFVDACDRYFGLGVVWVEADIRPGKGNGTRHRVVSHKTACRDGAASFEPMIAKYGIPNMSMPHCTRELKQAPIYSYVHTVWERGSFDVAIGIRADEFDRMSAAAKKNRIIYPLVKAGVTKPQINDFWDRMPFRLGLKGYQGNCKWCWKKTLRKHVTLMRESPEVYDFPRRMEEKYPMAGALAAKTGMPQHFFRKNMRVEDIAAMATDEGVENAADDTINCSPVPFDARLDVPEGSCSESCEVFHDSAEPTMEDLIG